MKIYGILNDSQEIKVDLKKFNPPVGYILMEEARPTAQHVATNEGKWILSFDFEKLEKEKEILDRLNEIDSLSIRPQRAIQTGLGADEDIEKIKILEEEAYLLRLKLKNEK